MRPLVFVTLAAGMMASIAMPACSRQVHPDFDRPAASDTEAMEGLPSDMQAAVAKEPKAQQEAFLARPAEERKTMAAEYERRQQMLASFTPAERTIISSMSQADTDDFFKIPPDQKLRQQQFLTEAVKTYLNSLDECELNTHRRFAPATELELAPRSLTGFTAPERAIIEHLTPAEAHQLFAKAKPEQEAFLSDTLERKVQQLLSCATRSNRRLRDSD